MSLTRIRLREAWNWGGLSARELAVRTWQNMDQHDTLNQAAVVAFYAMLSLVPLLSLALAVGAAAGVVSEVHRFSGQLLPPDADTIVRNEVRAIENEQPTGLLSLSIVLLLWSASSLFVAVMDTTNAAYGVRDSRPWWKRRLLALLLTLCEAILLVSASASIMIWPYAAEWLRLGTAATAAATAVQWVVVVIALLAAFAVAYYFGPQISQTWEWITPGATLGVLALIAASLGFRFYLRFVPNYNATYGALAGVVLMMLWFYLAGLALLVGAEINCTIEHAAPHGRAPGQKDAPNDLAVALAGRSEEAGKT